MILIILCVLFYLFYNAIVLLILLLEYFFLKFLWEHHKLALDGRFDFRHIFWRKLAYCMGNPLERGTHKRHEELKKRRAREKTRLFRFVSPFHERISNCINLMQNVKCYIIVARIQLWSFLQSYYTTSMYQTREQDVNMRCVTQMCHITIWIQYWVHTYIFYLTHNLS